MRLSNLLLIIVFSILSCSTVRVQYDYNTETNFTDYNTFDWLLIQPADNSVRNTLMDNRIKSAVSNELSAKGYQLKTGSPQFLITYHTNVKDKIEVSNYGYNYARRGRYAWIGTETEVRNYQEGTLIVDFIDAGNKELFWRGVANGSLPKEINPKIITDKVNEAVKEILKNYPPDNK